MGPNWVFSAKFLLDTTKSTHQLDKLLTLLSNQGWPNDDFGVVFGHQGY